MQTKSEFALGTILGIALGMGLRGERAKYCTWTDLTCLLRAPKSASVLFFGGGYRLIGMTGNHTINEYGAFTRFGPPFQGVPSLIGRLYRVHSPLLAAMTLLRCFTSSLGVAFWGFSPRGHPPAASAGAYFVRLFLRPQPSKP